MTFYLVLRTSEPLTFDLLNFHGERILDKSSLEKICVKIKEEINNDN